MMATLEIKKKVKHVKKISFYSSSFLQVLHEIFYDSSFDEIVEMIVPPIEIP